MRETFHKLFANILRFDILHFAKLTWQRHNGNAWMTTCVVYHQIYTAGPKTLPTE